LFNSFLAGKTGEDEAHHQNRRMGYFHLLWVGSLKMINITVFSK
jgi:hypothetical protein